MGILIKAGVDDHGLRSRKSIAQTSTTSTSNGHTATATTYKQAYSNGRTATATTYNDERNPRKEGFRAMRDPRRRRSTCTHRERPAQEHRGRHSRRHHDAVHHDAVHLDPRPGDYALTYTHYPPATDPCDCRGGCQWVWGYNICYVRDPHRCGWANHSRLRPGEKWRHCPGG